MADIIGQITGTEALIEARNLAITITIPEARVINEMIPRNKL